MLLAMPEIIAREELNRARMKLMYDALAILRQVSEEAIRKHVTEVLIISLLGLALV